MYNRLKLGCNPARCLRRSHQCKFTYFRLATLRSRIHLVEMVFLHQLAMWAVQFPHQHVPPRCTSPKSFRLIPAKVMAQMDFGRLDRYYPVLRVSSPNSSLLPFSVIDPFALSITCSLLLPLIWGGNERAWNDPVVIALFCTCGVLVIVWFIWEARLGERAVMPMSLWKNRTQVGACIEGFFTFAIFIVMAYYLPLLVRDSIRPTSGSSVHHFHTFLSLVPGYEGPLGNKIWDRYPSFPPLGGTR